MGFRYTHDVADLFSGLVSEGMQVPEDVREAVELTEYASGRPISRDRRNDDRNRIPTGCIVG